MTDQRNILGTIGPRFDATITANALINGNDTVSLTTARPYNGDGIIVAIPGNGILLPVRSAVYRDIVATWINRIAPEILSFPAPFYRPRFLGSWIDPGTGEWHLDIVEVFPREQFDDAIDAGTARGQIAIWDNGRKELFVTGAVD